MANQSRNTGALTSQAKGGATLTWDQATFTWAQAQGTWDNPFATVAQGRNTGTLTPQTKH